jgi:hypothetical protein
MATPTLSVTAVGRPGTGPGGALTTCPFAEQLHRPEANAAAPAGSVDQRDGAGGGRAPTL